MGDPRTVVVVGSGGAAAEVVQYLRDCAEAGQPLSLLGVVDDHAPDPTATEVCGAPVLGGLDAVAGRRGLHFIVASGTPRFRRESIELLRARGLVQHTLVHPRAHVARDAVIGEGCIVAPMAVVNTRASVGVGCWLNVFCSVGHDARVGDCCVLSPYAALNGGAVLGDQGFLGTRATVFPGVVLGERCTVDSHSCVRKDVPERSIVSHRADHRILRNRLES
jgi:sugar O-acyltransferase (sialic acid O-acetyltransferase NeuD family)